MSRRRVFIAVAVLAATLAVRWWLLCDIQSVVFINHPGTHLMIVYRSEDADIYSVRTWPSLSVGKNTVRRWWH